MKLPYLTGDTPGVGGVIKQRDEDFFVQEVPLYEPSGTGEHVYVEIQKVGLTTFQAIERLSRALRVPSRDIGYAGLKDAHALTRQVLSIRGTTEKAAMSLKWANMTIQWAARHENKLRVGHLAGNRFAVKIRNVRPTDVVKLKPITQWLMQRGMPNYFGVQRFGRRGDNADLGAALVRGDFARVLTLLLGHPLMAVDSPEQMTAREAFDAEDYDLALAHWPGGAAMERRVLGHFMKTRDAAGAVRAVDQRIRRLWVSALQSAMFNQVVARRIDSLGTLMPGDLAWKHVNGACFRVEPDDAGQVTAAEQSRCAAFEISPSGPLLGYRMTSPDGEPLRIEQGVFGEYGISAEEFGSAGRDKLKGARRPLRVQPMEVELSSGVDDQGEQITVAFTLPAGSFATVLLRELMKNDSTTNPMTDAAPSLEEAQQLEERG